jgi:hypothetical protein
MAAVRTLLRGGTTTAKNFFRWRSPFSPLKIQAGYKVQPLSSFLKQPAPPAPPVINYIKANAEIAKAQFWQLLDFALQYSPAEPEEPRPLSVVFLRVAAL